MVREERRPEKLRRGRHAERHGRLGGKGELLELGLHEAYEVQGEGAHHPFQEHRTQRWKSRDRARVEAWARRGEGMKAGQFQGTYSRGRQKIGPEFNGAAPSARAAFARTEGLKSSWWEKARR